MNTLAHPTEGPIPAPSIQRDIKRDSIDVSVIIPAYQCCQTITRALDSVFAQSFPHYEVIVINDGSPDTPMLRRALAPYLGRIRYIQQANRGPSAARNAGIHRASGTYLAFLDSDDFWLPHHLENQMNLLRNNPELGLVFANPLLLQGTTLIGTAFDLAPQHSQVTFESLLREDSRISTSSTVVSRADVLRAGLFDESLRRCEDFDLWLRLAWNGTRMAFNSDVQLCHRRANGLASDAGSMKRARVEVYEKTIRQLALSEEQRRIASRKILSNEAEIQLEVAKAALLKKHYNEALLAAERANHVLDSWKLRIAMKGLRTAPWLLLESYRAYEQILGVRNRNRTTKFLRQMELPSNFPPVHHPSA